MRHYAQCGTLRGLSLVSPTGRVCASSRYITLPRFCKRQLVPRQPSLAYQMPPLVTSQDTTRPALPQPDAEAASLISSGRWDLCRDGWPILRAAAFPVACALRLFLFSGCWSLDVLLLFPRGMRHSFHHHRLCDIRQHVFRYLFFVV